MVVWCISEWGKASQTSTIHNMKRNGFLKKPNLSSICFNLNFLLLCWLFSLTTRLEGPSVQNQRRKQEGWRSPVESRTAGRRAQGPGTQCPGSQPEPGLRRAFRGDSTTCKPPSVFLRPLTHPLLGSFQLHPDPKEVQLLSSPAFQMALVVKNPPANAGGMRPVSDSWVRKTHWRRKWQPLQYSYLEKPMDGNPMDRNPGAWRATVSPWGCKESDTPEGT